MTNLHGLRPDHQFSISVLWLEAIMPSIPFAKQNKAVHVVNKNFPFFSSFTSTLKVMLAKHSTQQHQDSKITFFVPRIKLPETRSKSQQQD